MDFDNLEQARQLALLPPEPVAPRSDRSAWGAPWRALKASTADVLGSTADVVKGFAAGSAITAQADPVAIAVMGQKAIDDGAEEGRRQIATDEALSSDIGESFRNVSAAMRPDPLTASTAEKLVFGVVRPLSKLAVGAAFGPIGIAGASAEEGFTQADDLRREGVDLQTRTAVGALTAGATGASAFLPMAGSTVKTTAGLYLAGGPGGFIAQQAATREILQDAGYDQIAQQFDPLDPVGLAMSSLIPLPFAAIGLRNARARVDVDAAMVHNLSTAQDAAEVRVATELQARADAPPVDSPPPVRPQPELPGKTAAEPAAADPLTEVRTRVKAIEETSPDVKAEMDRIRQAVQEGADDELGTLDADLLRVAADCALSIGS
jgi:hypothetical protein